MKIIGVCFPRDADPEKVYAYGIPEYMRVRMGEELTVATAKGSVVCKVVECCLATDRASDSNRITGRVVSV